MQTIQLHLRARHFKGTDFCQTGRCAIEKAADEVFDQKLSEGVYDLSNEKITYTHNFYGRDDFDTDAAAAKLASYDDTIIRTIELISV